jgi:hypothetical protein
MLARRLAVVAALCCAIMLAAGCGSGGAGSKISSALSGRTGTVTTVTTPGQTVVSTELTATATQTTSSDSGVPGWVWALLGALIVGILVAVYALGKSRRDKAAPTVPPEHIAPPPPPVARNLAERQQILVGELGRRIQGGWTVLSQTTDTAMLQRGAEHVEVRVDEFGTLHEGPPAT